MELSAELRLWWKGERPDAVEQWFEAAKYIAPGPPTERTDVYLSDPGQVELGIKMRGHGSSGSRTEAKLLVARRGSHGWLGAPEIWVKTSTAALNLDSASVILVRKRRRLRKFSAAPPGLEELAVGSNEQPASGESPDDGCNVEFTEVTAAERSWWTLGFESFGALDTVERTLGAAVAAMGDPPDPVPRPALQGSYPRWLAAVVGDENP